MPLNPTSGTKSSVSNRRAPSSKRTSDVIKSSHPVITLSVYNAIVRGTGGSENLKIKRLCQLKNLLGQFQILSDAALRDWNPQTQEQPSGTYNALRQVRTNIDRAFIRFPLQIENK